LKLFVKQEFSSLSGTSIVKSTDGGHLRDMKVKLSFYIVDFGPSAHLKNFFIASLINASQGSPDKTNPENFSTMVLQ